MDKMEEASREGYGRGIVEAGKQNENVVALECDLGKSTKSRMFKKEFPDRWFNCGISEQNMMITAAGLESCGKIPFASTFAIFTERGYEQIRNGIARQNLNVKIIGSHAGLLTGTDGSSAQSIEDIAIYRALPNMKVICPADSVEAEKATLDLMKNKGPAYMRLTRDKTPVLFDDTYIFEIGKSKIMRKGKDISIIACGPLVAISLNAASELKGLGIDAEVINMSTIKPIDEKAVIMTANKTKKVITAEDHNIIGGLGSAVAEVIAEKCSAKLYRIGVRDVFGESGSPEELYEKYKLTSKDIVNAAKGLMK